MDLVFHVFLSHFKRYFGDSVMSVLISLGFKTGFMRFRSCFGAGGAVLLQVLLFSALRQGLGAIGRSFWVDFWFMHRSIDVCWLDGRKAKRP